MVATGVELQTWKRLSQKQLEPLELNWLLIEHANHEKVLVVSVDALFSCNLLEEKIIKELNSQKIFVNGLYSVASHTHFAPAIDNSKPELGRADPKYFAPSKKPQLQSQPKYWLAIVLISNRQNLNGDLRPKHPEAKAN